MAKHISVPISYRADVIVKGGTKERSMSFGEHLDLTIDEVDEKEAPVAFVWNERVWRGGDLVDNEKTLRLHDGRLWQNYRAGASREIPVDVSFATFRETAEQGSNHNNPLHNGDWRTTDYLNGEIGPLSPEAWRKADMSARQKAIDVVSAEAARMIVIDDMLWVEAEEPVYSIRYYSGLHGMFSRPTDDKETVFVEIHDGVGSTTARNDEHIFRADRYDDMVAYGLDRWGIEPETVRYISVLIPDAVRYDDEWPPLLAMLTRGVKTEESSVSGMPIPQMMNWAQARDALAEVVEHPDDTEARASLVAIMRDYLEELRQNDGGSWLVGSLDDAFDRWDRQTLSNDLETAMSAAR